MMIRTRWNKKERETATIETFFVIPFESEHEIHSDLFKTLFSWLSLCLIHVEEENQI